LSCLLKEQLLEPALNLTVHCCGLEFRVLNGYDQKSFDEERGLNCFQTPFDEERGLNCIVQTSSLLIIRSKFLEALFSEISVFSATKLRVLLL
ncbi:hypothetical protein Tco_0314354, partial [Tanacetum coccineum]